MGQLEKYGLYVLCLVIFMILGVTIWGGDEGAPQRSAASIRAAAGDPPARPGKEVPVSKVEPSADILALLRGDQGADGRRSGAAPAPATPPPPAANANEASPGAAKPNGDAAGAPPAAGSAPTAGGAPVAAASRATYKVQSGDTFEAIAKKRLGSAALTAELQRLNPGIESHKLQVGTELVLPAAGEIAKGEAREAAPKPDASKPETGSRSAAGKPTPPVRGAVAAERNYVIHKGDTLEGIARAELGSSKRVDEVRQMNPNLDPTRLKIGTRIKLPAK